MKDKNRSKWEIGRLWKTLTYFEVIPLISKIQKILSPLQATKVNQLGQIKMGKILVVGATGGVGKRVVRQLLANDYSVRALVRDINQAQKLFGEQVELFEADFIIPETLTPQLMESVTAVICCTGTKVQPVEGDTANREKYYQGIKFYLPEVVDTPEMVEYQGIKNLVQVVRQYIQPTTEKMLFDFTNSTTQIKEIWGAVDDVVMGGVSQSNLRLNSNRAIFSGVVSTDNNGGFASVRTRNFNPPFDLSDYEGIELRVTGDGKRYKFITRCEGKWDGIGYCYSFDTIYNFPTTIRVPFRDLIPVFRAKTVPDAGEFDSSKVYSMQLMLSKFEYDGKLNPKFEPGNFSLDIEYIKAYGSKAKPQFVMISSAGVTRPNRPGINLAEEPPAVRMNDQLGGILTWKLQGEEAVRNSGLTYTIIRPCALTEQPGDKLLWVEQGDNLKGQVSRDAIATMAIAAINSPLAVNKTFEVREETQTGKVDWQALFSNLQPDS
ncbi:NADH:ubiquinone oxidoreductase complex I intermediate-associated protein 30 [Stanieria cyanosphaera PCC 7437]|uniref:NADH:ubiquinone oxidoreductase complex I intermediate-associated protein 30 n=1 Tax=Stanieria cyanosphaera (strain ATCC 29371 / PCC 7437) TaxID=111780 RepID=K9XXJ1_STAC7|nr:CIA30 family protein [Stanieria cyanosphaera]AFZ36382.1 NADH:ubiquinone oxidoreductase complex I intermediate-associated protein 30 [Stanieria cyanosphaera PCC 7437]